MSQFNMFNFLLAAIVFTILTVTFAVFIVYLVKMDLKLIRLGGNDKKITKEYLKYGSKKHGCVGCVGNTIYGAVSAIIAVVMVLALVFSLMVQLNEGRVCTDLPLLNVVQSGSMSYVNEKNDYIDEGDYTDQFDKFDIVLTHELPAEEDLKVGDVVVYEVDGSFLIHRIVGIEEPNEKHPNERHFLLMGDANETPDRFPVRYSQMKSIYKGEHVAYVGTFVLFIQSPAGWLCVLLVLFAVVATPLAERKLAQTKYARLVEIGVIVEDKPQNDNPSDDNPMDDNPTDDNPTDDNPTDDTPVDEQAQPDSMEDVVDEPAEEQAEDVVEQAEPDCMAIVVDNQPVEDAEPIADAQADDVVATQTDRFGSYGEGKTFAQKVDEAQEPLASRYAQIVALLLRIDKVRVLRGKKRESYSKGRMAVAKLAIRGKTLNVYLALDPNDYADSKYIFVDESQNKTYQNTPVHLKLTSDRQTKWAIELILDLVAKNNWTLLDEQAQPDCMANVVDNESAEEQAQSDSMEDDVDDEQAEEVVATQTDRFGSYGAGKTFAQKLDEAQEPLAGRYAQISALLGRIKKVRVLRGKKRESYSKGRMAVAKLVIRGKTLNVYLALDPKQYIDTKYKFVDQTDNKTYQKTPMQLKLTSDRQTKWAKELILDLVAKNNWTLIEQATDDNVTIVVEQAQPDSMANVVEQEPVAEIVEECQNLSNDDEQAQELEQDLQRLREYRNNLSEQDRAEFDSFADPDADVSDRGIDLVADFIVANEQARRAEQAEPASVGEDVEQEPVEDVVEEQAEDVDQQESQNEPQQASDLDELAVDKDDNVVCDDNQTADNVIDVDPATEQAQPDSMEDVVDETIEQPVEQVETVEDVVEQEEEQPIEEVVEQVAQQPQQKVEPQQKPLVVRKLTGQTVATIKSKKAKKSRKVR